MNFNDIPLGTPEQFNVLVEIPTGSVNKYELNEHTGFITLDYVFKDGFCFPFNYGFVPHTKAGDNDPLDAVILSTSPICINTVVMVKPIAILKLKDKGEQDNKLITVPVVDPLANKLNNVDDLTDIQKQEIKEFFKQVGVQKNKTMDIEEIYDKEEAINEVKKCAEV